MAGNTVSRTIGNDTLSFAYSPYGEMLSSMKNGITTDYSYDHTRRRVTKSTPWLIEHHVIDWYEVEYESGAILVVKSEQWTNNNTGTTNIRTNYDPINAQIINTGIVNTGSTNTWTSYTWTTSTGISLSESGITSTGSTTSTGETSTGTTSIGSIDTSTWILDTPTTNTGDTSTGTLSSSGIASVRYIFIAGYESSWGTPATLTTTLTHIMLGDERIATFQTQSDDSPKTLDDDKLVYHISDHLNSSSLDLSSTGMVLQAVDYQPFWKSNTYDISIKRVKWKKWWYTNKYLFANKQLDEESDLQYFEKRYYDNRIGRFTTEDPVFWEVGLTKRPNNYFASPQNWNSYSYTLNNPINLVDPTGEESMDYWLAQTFQSFQNQGYTNIGSDIQKEWNSYKEAWQQITTTIAQNFPGTGDANDIYSAVRWEDLYTWEKIQWWNRALAWAAAFIPGVSWWEMRAGKEAIKFSEKALSHMKNSDRYIPASLMDKIVKSTKWVPDPRWTTSTMHYWEMSKNGKTYNVEVLYNKAMNMIQHFKYTEKPIWNLASKKK